MEEETIQQCWSEYDKLNTKYIKQGKQLEACGKLYVTARDELAEARKTLAEIYNAVNGHINHWQN